MNANEPMGNMAAIQKHISIEPLNQSLNKTNLIEEKPGERLNGEKIELVNPPEFAGIVLPFYLAITAGVLIVFQLSRQREHLANDFLSRLKRVPCRNCHFFTMNPNLKCAVNPARVLTKQAIDCLDYRPRNGTSVR